MPSDSREEEEVEFDLVATWTAEVVADLGPDVAVPAACRGSAKPAALTWLAESLQLDPRSRLVDLGGGLGGPAAWARDHYGVDAVVVEPMPGACAGASALFGLSTVNADATAVPLRSHAMSAGWILGVLDSVRDAAGVLAEAARLVGPGGRVGLLEYVAAGSRPARQVPTGNQVRSRDDLLRLLDDQGFEVVDHRHEGERHDAPADWQRCIDRVDAALAIRHGRDPRWRVAQARADRLGHLLTTGEIEPVVVHARAGR